MHRCLAFGLNRLLVRGQVQPGLLRPNQAKINIGKKLAIEKRAVLVRVELSIPVAAAKRVEIVGAAGMLPPGQRQRVRHAIELLGGGSPSRPNS